tara:strand:+ start:504 stop:1160 length:657 start_codon:yes stop_codon:yes gene_type:complete
MSTTLNGRSYVLFVKNQKDGCWKSLKKFIVSDHRDNGVFGQYIRSNMYQEKVQNKKEYIEFFVISFIDEPQMVQIVNCLNNTSYTIKNMIDTYDFLEDIWHFHIGPISQNHSDEWIESSAKSRSNAVLRFKLRLLREKRTEFVSVESEECKMPESQYKNCDLVKQEIENLREKIAEAEQNKSDNLNQLEHELLELETPWDYYYLITTPEMVIAFPNHT